MRTYFEPERANDQYALPDLEVFWHDKEDHFEGDCFVDGDGDPLESGFYFWCCLPGCLPEGDPIGPYKTEKEAIESARDMFCD